MVLYYWVRGVAVYTGGPSSIPTLVLRFTSQVNVPSPWSTHTMRGEIGYRNSDTRVQVISLTTSIVLSRVVRVSSICIIVSVSRVQRTSSVWTALCIYHIITIDFPIIVRLDAAICNKGLDIILWAGDLYLTSYSAFLACCKNLDCKTSTINVMWVIVKFGNFYKTSEIRRDDLDKFV